MDPELGKNCYSGHTGETPPDQDRESDPSVENILPYYYQIVNYNHTITFVTCLKSPERKSESNNNDS